MTSVLFVCLGNICRSPTAEGLFRHHAAALGLSDRLVGDSAGTGGWHTGDPPDDRSIRAAGRRGVPIHDLRARQVTPADFDRFDLVLGMDRQNVANLKRLQPQGSRARLGLFLEETLGIGRDVPDPYYGTESDFADVFDLCDRGVRALVERFAETIRRGAPAS